MDCGWNTKELLHKSGMGFRPRSQKADTVYIGMIGLGCVSRAVSLRAGNLFEGTMGILEVTYPMSSVEVRDVEAFDAVTPVSSAWKSVR